LERAFQQESDSYVRKEISAAIQVKNQHKDSMGAEKEK